MEYHSFLLKVYIYNKIKARYEFPSPYGVSFILIDRYVYQYYIDDSFRLLMEYHSFLLTQMKKLLENKIVGFPSPYGVSFILIRRKNFNYFRKYTKFPSPYGVSFILIRRIVNVTGSVNIRGFRLLMEYHSFL